MDDSGLICEHSDDIRLEEILRIVVLGGGRVGSAIVRDLAAEDDYSVRVVDLDPVRVERMTEFGAWCGGL